MIRMISANRIAGSRKHLKMFLIFYMLTGRIADSSPLWLYVKDL